MQIKGENTCNNSQSFLDKQTNQLFVHRMNSVNGQQKRNRPPDLCMKSNFYGEKQLSPLYCFYITEYHYHFYCNQQLLESTEVTVSRST